MEEPKTTEAKFTCEVKGDCNFISFVKKGDKILAFVADDGGNGGTDSDVIITGGLSKFTVTVKKKKDESQLGMYYCGARTTDDKEDKYGYGTHIYSGKLLKNVITITEAQVPNLWYLTCLCPMILSSM